jgi:radical SAM superfamily enzyme YgiQ (UPF0313 family)
MKVLLVYPPRGFNTKDLMPPLGLAYIAAVLEENNIKVEVVDAEVERLSWKALQKRCEESKPDVIGITSLSESRFESFKSAKIAKQAIPNALVLMGGPHASLTAEDTLANIPSVDIVVRGEGEYTVKELCDVLETDGDLHSVDGISFRENGNIIHTKNRQLIQDIDTLPLPAHHLLPLDKYNFTLDVPGKGKLPAMNVITSRGCPIGCTFCATSKILGKGWRARSPANIIFELEHLIEKYGTEAIFFYDDLFTMNKKRTFELCNLMIERGLDLNYICMTRVDTLDKPLLTKMKESGCYRIHYGVESGSQKILDNIVEKKIKINQVKQVSKWLDELEIIKNAFFIVSFPEETHEDVNMTLALMNELGGEPSLSFLKVYPGTEIERIAKVKGVIPADFSWSKESSSAIFSIPAIQGNVPLFMDKLNWDELTEIAIRWAEMRKDYSIFNRIIDIVRNIRSYEDIKRIAIFSKIYFKRKIGF